MRCETMDKSYATAVAYLKKNIGEIHEVWNGYNEEVGGSLFLYVTPTGGPHATPLKVGRCGCLTQIKSGECVVMGFRDSEALTDEIRADPNIPTYWDGIKEEHLSHFAKWQRRLDKLAKEEAHDNL